MTDLYHEAILEEIQNLQHQGELHGDDVHQHHERNASCGDEVRVFVRSNDEGVITELAWQGQGCAISMASMSLLAQKLNQEKLTKAELEKLELKDILELLGLDEIVPGRLKCALLGLKAIRQSVAIQEQFHYPMP